MRIPVIASLSALSLFLTSMASAADGVLWTAGNNSHGELGVTPVLTTDPKTGATTFNSLYEVTPQQLDAAGDVKAVAAGDSMTFVIKADNTLWASGFNFHGGLGTGNTDNYDHLTQITDFGNDVAAVSAGVFHTLVVKISDGTVWASGSNEFGQLGDGTNQDSLTFKQVPGFDHVKKALAVGWHSLIIDKDGKVWAFGNDHFGQLGLGINTDSPTPTPTEVKFNNASINATDVAGGQYHSLILTTDGILLGTGMNSYGQLGLPTIAFSVNPVQISDGVASIAAGDTHTDFIKTDNTLWGCGQNRVGQVGVFGSSLYTIPTKIESSVTRVFAGGTMTFFVKKDGSCWVVGGNRYGQLGFGNTENQPVPVLIAGPLPDPSKVPVPVALGETHSLMILPPAEARTGINPPATLTLSTTDQISLYATPFGTPVALATYQWKRDGVDIAYNGRASQYTLSLLQTFDSGTYSPVLKVGASSIASTPTVVTINPVASSGTLVNLSTRGQILTGTSAPIIGFVLTPQSSAATKSVLLRAIGPGLVRFGVSNTISDPQITLKKGTVDDSSNDNWASATNLTDLTTAMTTVGAFALDPVGKDAALLRTLGAGQYSLLVSGVGSATGVGLMELYDAGTSTSEPHLSNMSMRTTVDAGSKNLVVGFVITGGPLNVLLRAVGPGLASMVTDTTLADPTMTVYAGGYIPLFSNNDWGDTTADSVLTTKVASEVGAFALTARSKDSAVVLTLNPGVYTVEINSNDGTAGIALAEIYAIPGVPGQP